MSRDPERTPSAIDVVVPVFGQWDMTRACLLKLREQTVGHTVVVVDDASPDDTPDRVAAEFPEVVLLRKRRNEGFARACNDGIRAGRADVVVLLNNDVEAAPDFLERLAAPLAADGGLGSAVPLLLRPDGTVDAYGVCADVTLAGFVRGQGRHPDDIDEGLPELLGPYGAGAAFSRHALDEVGVLDERIFMYGEELDLAIRLRAAGWGTTPVPAATGVHLGGGTAGRGSSSQRERGGFGRGYTLRAYGVLRTRRWARVLVTEAVVCLGDAVLSRDAAALRGRVRGWRAGRVAEPKPSMAELRGLDARIGFWRSLQMRRADHEAGRAARAATGGGPRVVDDRAAS